MPRGRLIIKRFSDILRNLYYFPPKPISFILTKYMISDLRRKRMMCLSVNDVVKFAFLYRNILSRTFELIPWKPEYAPFTILPAQVPSEIIALLKMLKELKPRRILEIGTERGGTLMLFTEVASPSAILISIDLPSYSGVFGFSYPRWKEDVYRSFAKWNQKVFLIRGDSHDSKTLRKVKSILGNDTLDFLFIDGDHSYEGVKRDFEMYSPLVRRGGIIAFHDIVPGPPEKVGGVPRFWKEVKTKFKSLEIVRSWRQGGFGIGVVYK